MIHISLFGLLRAWMIALSILYSIPAFADTNPLIGVWNSNCVNWQTPQNGKTWSRVDQRSFLSDQTYIHFSIVYRGPGCRGEVYYTRTVRGTYTIPPSLDIRGYGSLDLVRTEEVIDSNDEKLSDEKETLVVLERDIFFIFDHGRKACFGRRVFRKPRRGEDLIDQLAERPAFLWTDQIFTKTESEGEGLRWLL